MDKENSEILGLPSTPQLPFKFTPRRATREAPAAAVEPHATQAPVKTATAAVSILSQAKTTAAVLKPTQTVAASVSSAAPPVAVDVPDIDAVLKQLCADTAGDADKHPGSQQQQQKQQEEMQKPESKLNTRMRKPSAHVSEWSAVRVGCCLR